MKPYLLEVKLPGGQRTRFTIYNTALSNDQLFKELQVYYPAVHSYQRTGNTMELYLKIHDEGGIVMKRRLDPAMINFTHVLKQDCASSDGSVHIPEDADTYLPGDELGEDVNPLRLAMARHERVAKAKVSIDAAIRIDEDQYRHVSMEKLVDAVHALDMDTLRELVLDHIYRGGSFT